MLRLIIDDGMPVSFTAAYEEVIRLPLGWHKGEMCIYTFTNIISLVCINFYDKSSCILVKDEVNDAYQYNKQVFLCTLPCGTTFDEADSGDDEKSVEEDEKIPKIVTIIRNIKKVAKSRNKLKAIKEIYDYDYSVVVVE